MNERGDIPAMHRGTQGAVYVGAVKIGTLTEWRIVSSPTTGKPTLIARGSFARAWAGKNLSHARAVVIEPTPTHLYGRPRPRPRQSIAITGTVARLSVNAITISNGTIQ